MQEFDDIIVKPDFLLRDVLEILDRSEKKVCLVLDVDERLIGTITDGDIRRALLRNTPLSESIEKVFCENPTVVHFKDSKHKVIELCRTKKIQQVPVVDDAGFVVGLEVLDDLIGIPEKEHKVVLMVGGLGMRLRPLTEDTPKSMLLVGGKPILHRIVESFVSCGFKNIIMCVGYKAEHIKEYFQDGSRFGARIEYVEEEQRLGTAGALSLLKSGQVSDKPFFVMNGDLLTNVNFGHLLDFHVSSSSQGTMCVRKYEFQVPYGVVNVDDTVIKGIDEKPIHRFFVSAGVYVLSPSCIDLVPGDTFFDMPSLFERLISENQRVVSYPLYEDWIDIGKMEEYKRANDVYIDGP